MREYVFMNLKKYKRNKCIECTKINSDMVSTLKYKYKRETISELINFINKTFVIGYDISNDTIKYTCEYTIYSDNKLKDYKYMIDKMNRALEFLKEHPSLNIKLICIGNIEELKENYKVLGEDKLQIILDLIIKEKEL